MKNYAIVGFGCAGFHAARAIRQLDPSGRIAVFSDTGQPPFNPMLTTYYASEKLELDGVFPFGGMEEIQRKLSLELYSDMRVRRVDTAHRSIELEGGQMRGFDAILIATGASALVPGPLRRGGGDFFLMRTLNDAQRLRRRLEQGGVKRAVVVGGSMVGIKVAELLYRRGVEVTLADGAPYLFPLAAYESTAHAIQQRLEERGLDLIFRAQVSAVTPKGVTLADGRTLEADLVCLCIGTRANVELVANTQVLEGENVQIERGIVVDEGMRTNVPGIYAAGDCCEGVNLQTGKTAVIGLWANAGAQGDCAGRNMAGQFCRYYGNILHNITHFFDMDFIGLGDPNLPGERCSFREKGFTVEAILEDGKLNSINLFGNYRISGILKNHLTKRLLGGEARLTPAQQGLLAAGGLSRAFIPRIGGE